MHKQIAVEELEKIMGYGDVIEGTLEGVVVMINSNFLGKVVYQELKSQRSDGVEKVKLYNSKVEFTLVSEIEKVSVASSKYPRIKLYLKSGGDTYFEVANDDFVQGALQTLMLQLMRATQK